MAHSLQPGAQGAQEPFDFNQIFIGREQQMAEFGRLLREWKYMLVQEEVDAPGVPELPSPRNKLPGLVVMLYGRGGFGKSTLLNRYYGLATQANEQGLGGRLTLCGPVDWEFAVEGRRAIYNPSQGQALDPLAYYKDLCAQLASRLDKQPGDFRAYQQAVSEVEKVRRESGKILEEVRREQDDLGAALRGATIDIVASALSTYVPGSKGIVQNEKVKKGADALLQLTGEQVAYLYQRFQRRLGERLEEYLDPARRLGFALGRDLARYAANYPILIFFDTYEEVDEGDQLLRLVMAAAGPRVGWIIAGRDNLWSGVGQRERSTTPEYGYKDLVPFERGLSVNFNSEDVGAFTPDNIREYFELLCQRFPCEPPLPMLAQDEITCVWDVTKGIPLAVNIAAALYSETVDINKVTEEVEGRKEIIDKMVYRYLQHTRIDESERGKLYALALLRRTDEPMILARALGLTLEEAKTHYKEMLSHLHRRYSFIFTEKGEPSLHQEVRHFLRLFLLERRKEPEIQAINSSLKESIETALQALEQRRAYNTLKERLQDEDWTALYLDLCEQLYWLDPTEGLRHLLPFMIAAAIHNREINGEAEEIGEFFTSSLSVHEQSKWTWTASSLIKSHNRKPSSEELHGLEELYKRYSQPPGRLPLLLDYPQELEAALCWRLGEANLRQNTDKAVEWYEQAFARLPQEEELKDALAGSYYELGKKIRHEERYDESIRLLSQAIELKPKYTYAFVVRGLVYEGLQQFDKAIDDYNAAILLDPNSARAYYNRGNAYAKLQQFDQAIDDYNAAVLLDPNYAIAYNNRGNAHYDLQQFDKAIDNYNAAIRLDPNSILAYNNRGNAYANLHQFDQALEDFSTAIRLNPNYVIAYNNQGNAYANLHQFDKAIDSFSVVIRLDPSSIHAYYNRGNAYAKLQQFDKAIDDYKTTILLDPNYARAHNNQGSAYYDLDQFDKAIDSFNAAIHFNPNYAIAYRNRGNVYMKSHQFDQALDSFNVAIHLNPNDAFAYLRRGYSYLYVRDIKNAKEDFFIAAEKNPQSGNIAWMCVFASLAERHAELEVAERLEKIAAIDSQESISQVCLGVALGLRGKLKTGLEKLEEAIQANPELEDAFFWKGILCAYYYQGKPHLAIEAIEQALANDLPPVLLRPLYWLREDNPAFFEQYARPLLERYGV